MAMTLANRITILRFICIPVFIILVTYYNASHKGSAPNDILRWAATFLFVITVFLDGLDGYIARTRNQITRLGTIIDPLADKALLLSGLILLGRPSVTAFESHLPMWFVTVVISRDVILVAGAVIIHFITGTVTVKPRFIGKATSVSQMAVITWVLAGISTQIFPYIVLLAASLTIISGAQYIFDGAKQLEKAKEI